MISLETCLAWDLKSARARGDLVRRKIVSSFERMRFWWRISGVMKGLEGREGQEKDLRGAWMSRMEVIVELKRERYWLRDDGVEVWRSEARISLEKAVGSMDLKARESLVRGLGRW